MLRQIWMVLDKAFLFYFCGISAAPIKFKMNKNPADSYMPYAESFCFVILLL